MSKASSPSVLNRWVIDISRKGVNHVSWTDLVQHVFGVAWPKWIFHGVQMVEIAKEFIKAMHGRQVLVAIAVHRVGNRPGRLEPRLRKRRTKKYDYMMKPRNETKIDILKGLTN